MPVSGTIALAMSPLLSVRGGARPGRFVWEAGFVKSIPTGTVSFLFTDVVGSTRLWDQSAEAMRVALGRHDQILRAAIDGHDGFVFSTTGDGFAAAFSTAERAVAAAVEAQQALSGAGFDPALHLEVRMAVHSGAAEERDGDYFGPALNRAARLMAIAHGGQILVSSAVAALLREPRLTAITLHDLGEHALRGLQEPERVFAVRASGLTLSYSPLFPVAGNGNLPQPTTSFVGRVQELKALTAELAPRRLVTLTGPGGVGKTRLSVEAAWAARENFSGGALIVELAPLNQPDAVGHAVAKALGARVQDSTQLIEAIVDSLGTVELLLVLDNCEHVIDAVSRLAGRLLGAAPGVGLLATSREPLGVEGEHVWPVRPLDPTLEGVDLFRERAKSADSSYELGDDGELVAQLCRRLDGIPLAIELAAAQIRTMTPADLIARLDDRFRLLRGSRSADARHLTLRTTVEWSYQLLDQTERDLYDRLSVFAGTFDLAAVEAVCTQDGEDPLDAVESISALVDKSLVEASRSGITVRYSLLETLRTYADERLAEPGRRADTRRRHLRHYLTVAEAARRNFEGDDYAAGARRFEGEWDNIRVAVATAIEEGEGDSAGRLVDAACWYAHHHLRDELGDWARQAAAMPDASPLAFGAAAVMAMLAGDYEVSISLAEQGCARAPDPTTGSTLQGRMGATASHYLGGGTTQAYTEGQRYVDAALARGDPFNVAAAVAMLGLAAASAALDTVVELAHRARSLAAPLRNPVLDAWVDCLLGTAEFAVGDRAGAVAAWRRAQSAGAQASPFIEVIATMSLATVAASELGDESPSNAYRGAIRRLATLRVWSHLWIAVESLAAYWADIGRLEEAGVLLGHLDAHGRHSVNQARRRLRAAARVAEEHKGTEWLDQGRALDRTSLLTYIDTKLAETDSRTFGTIEAAGQAATET